LHKEGRLIPKASRTHKNYAQTQVRTNSIHTRTLNLTWNAAYHGVRGPRHGGQRAGLLV